MLSFFGVLSQFMISFLSKVADFMFLTLKILQAIQMLSLNL